MYTVSCTLSPVHCLLYTVSCTLSPVHCLLYTVSCTLSPAHCPLYTVFCTLSPVHCCPLYTVSCTYTPPVSTKFLSFSLNLQTNVITMATRDPSHGLNKIVTILCNISFQGEMDVATLIKTMDPCLMPDVYVFITIQNNDTVPVNIYQRFVQQFRDQRYS